MLNEYRVYNFFDQEIAKFFERYKGRESELEAVPLCVFEVVFNSLLLNPDIRELKSSDELSRRIQQGLDAIVKDPAKYLSDHELVMKAAYVNSEHELCVIISDFKQIGIPHDDKTVENFVRIYKAYPEIVEVYDRSAIDERKALVHRVNQCDGDPARFKLHQSNVSAVSMFKQDIPSSSQLVEQGKQSTDTPPPTKPQF